VAFTGAEGIQHTPAFVARADGHDRKRIANLWSSENCFAPDWSPSGSQLVYLAGCDNDATALFVVDRDGRHRRTLGLKMWTLSAKWSPDGKLILFAARPAPPRAGPYALFLAPTHRGKLRRLSGIRFDFLYGVGWAWSPDSKRIFLLAETRGSNRGLELSVVDRGGGRLTTLTPPDLNVGDFDISPDGRHIALQAAKGTHAWEIYVMRADGTGLEQLTHNRAHDRSPRWSRDGRQILFESQRDGNFEIYVMRGDGRNQKRLTRNPADDFSATWVPRP